MTRRRPLLALAAALVVGACSVGPRAPSDPAPSASPSPSVPLAAVTSASPPAPSAADPSPSAVATPSVRPTIPLTSALPSGATPKPSPSGTPRPGPTFRPEDLVHEDPGLEALLPTRVGTVALLHMSALGDQLDYGGGDVCSFVCPLEARMMADGVGATVDDLSAAFAFDAGFDHHLISVWRVDGATGAELRDARIAMFDSEAPFPLIKDFPVEDDTVTVAIRSAFPDDTHFLVARDDVLFVIWYGTDWLSGIDPVLPDGVREIVEAFPQESVG